MIVNPFFCCCLKMIFVCLDHRDSGAVVLIVVGEFIAVGEVI